MTEVKKEEYRGFDIRVVMVRGEYRIILLRDGRNSYRGSAVKPRPFRAGI
jgi:hypothetical protein